MTILQDDLTEITVQNAPVCEAVLSRAAFVCESDAAWNSLVDNSECQDIYYRPGYVRAYETAGSDRAVAVTVAAGGSTFLVPLIIRPLRQISFGHEMDGYDAITPYGYGGLLHVDRPLENSQDTIQEFCDSLRGWCLENGVVSILLRLHPLLQQEEWFHRSQSGVILAPYGRTVALDLHDWNENKDRLSGLSRGRRADLNRAHRHLRLTWASESPEHIGEHLLHFQKIYEERMKELEANKSYFFPPEYYFSLASGLGRDFDVSLAWSGDELVAGIIYMAGPQFAHAHLTGANETGRLYGASTMLINEGARWARRRGCRWLHLGGGKSGEDALFEFKKTFGGSLFQYSSVWIIADPMRYERLVSIRRAQQGLPEPRANFFPEYRA